MFGAARRFTQIPVWVTPALVAVVGVGLAAFAFLASHKWNEANAKADFEEGAARRLVQLQDTINVHVTLLRSIAGLYAASEFVSRQEFATFVSNVISCHVL